MHEEIKPVKRAKDISINEAPPPVLQAYEVHQPCPRASSPALAHGLYSIACSHGL
ncbi:MAG TPA: hypothetical protein VNN73_11185 [Blastocatellia bacterium]|jgi:hypothetical protein|nr:hypothetical protein [Blastocatellia bacterium]